MVRYPETAIGHKVHCFRQILCLAKFLFYFHFLHASFVTVIKWSSLCGAVGLASGS